MDAAEIMMHVVQGYVVGVILDPIVGGVLNLCCQDCADCLMGQC